MKKTLLSLTFILVAFISNAQWVEQNSGSTHWFNSICFVDENTGWICGFNGSDVMLIHTTDAGANWIPQSVPVTVFYGEVTFLDANTGWACGQNGTLLKSTDGGETWSQLTIDMTGTLQSVYFVDENNGWCVGQSGSIFHSTDGGESWVLQNSGSDKYLIRTRFLNSMVGWATGIQGTVLYTNDGGETWVTQTSNVTYDISSISIVDENNVWLGSVLGGGGKSAFDNGAVVHTSDAGTTWEVQYTSTEQVNTVSFVDLNKGWFFGSNGTIMHTVDGGATWESQYTGVSNIFAVGQMVDEYNGWCTGQDGIIMHNSNAVGISDFESGQTGIQISSSPNPFSGNTKINFSIAENSAVEITIYDVSGKLVATLVNEEMQAGNNSVTWDASSLAGGIYYCTLKSGNEIITKKLISK